MHARITVSLLCGASLITSFNCFAQGASGASCVSTPAQLEANKKVATAFFRPGITPDERLALIDPSYVQHNPRFKKAADEEKISAYEEFKKMFARATGNFGPPPSSATTQPQPPANVPLELVTAECDLVTVIHKNYRQDPSASPGTFYEAFTFDTFRVRNGKLVEHWDSATIDLAPPPPAGR